MKGVIFLGRKERQKNTYEKEIRRVLKHDGVVFWNIGDTYYSSPSNQQGKGSKTSGVGIKGCRDVGRIRLPKHNIIKTKELCLIPARFAIAAQEDGWFIRSDIIWSKTNPMPESVKDRPTRSHEYIYLLTKSSSYYWNPEAGKKPAVRQNEKGILSGSKGRNFKPDKDDPNYRGGYEQSGNLIVTGKQRNIWTVWSLAVEAFKGDHPAVFPKELPEICIGLGSRPGDIILDPFAGSGTTLLVARKMGRLAIGYEISAKYCRLIQERNSQGVIWQ